MLCSTFAVGIKRCVCLSTSPPLAPPTPPPALSCLLLLPQSPCYQTGVCGCSERLAQVQLSVEQDPDMTFAPAINERSMRLAISKELREVREDVPAGSRLTLRQPLKLTAGKGPYT